jgi:hypothetical protein
VRNRLKVELLSPVSRVGPSPAPAAVSHTATGPQLYRVAGRFASRKFRTPEGPPSCDQALTPAKAWAVIAAEGVVRWCVRCNRFRAGVACARGGPVLR